MNNETTRPAFLITIDTEGDNLWSKPRAITTQNSRFLPRFQMLCERFGFKPVYLTNWEMAHCPVFQEFARDVLRRRTGEVGMHLHAWNSPPCYKLTEDDYRYQPYLVEYPDDVLQAKVGALTAELENIFGVKMLSHRAGRWGFDARYARALVEHGYRVDCTVSPHASWRPYLGHPAGRGGPDYTHFPDGDYFVDLNDVSRPGDSPLLEVPFTVLPNTEPRWARRVLRMLRCNPFSARLLRRLTPDYLWLRPYNGNLRCMLKIVEIARLQRRPYIEFMLHSSEFMPGGSPRFPNDRSIEILYHDLEVLFATARQHFEGCTLADYYDRVAQFAYASDAKPSLSVWNPAAASVRPAARAQFDRGLHGAAGG